MVKLTRQRCPVPSSGTHYNLMKKLNIRNPEINVICVLKISYTVKNVHYAQDIRI